MSFKEEKEDESYYLNYESESLLGENDKDKEKNNINIENNSKSEINNNIESKKTKNSQLEENLKINHINNDHNNSTNEENGRKKEIQKENKISESRKTLFSPFMQKFMNKILSLDENEKPKIKKKYPDDEFFSFSFSEKRKKKKKKLNLSLGNLSNEDSSFNINTSLIQKKKKTIIKDILELKKENEWSEFIEEYQKKNEEKKFTKKLKSLFNINSDFMIIWKISFSIFYMVILYMLFFKYVFLELTKLNNNEKPKKRILYLYSIINIMFAFDLILTIIVILNNGGSTITFLKLPLKFYMVIPFPLKSKNIPYLMPKFCRVDLFKRVFDSIEQFLINNITHYIQNYNLRNFIIYTNRMFTYLLEFGLYGHFTCCIFSYIEGIKYVSALYYTIETFTTIGFGEISPQYKNSLCIAIINLYIGINLFCIMTCNVNYLSSKLYAFSRETSLKQQLEFLFFKMQTSTGKVFPLHLKQLISFFILFRRGLSYKDIQTQNEPTLRVVRNKMIKSIRKTLLSFLRKEFSLFFPNCEKQFINSLLEVLKPKIFKTNKIIVNYGQKVKYLYFLINGQLFVYNKKEKPVYTIFNSAIFCEYEFIIGVTCDYMIRVHPKLPAYGFTISKEDWDNIAKKYINSAKKFINMAYEKRKRHLQWLNKSYKIGNIILEINNDEKGENLNNNIKEDKNNIKNKNNAKNKKKENKINLKKDNNNIINNLLISVKSKNGKFNLDNSEIIRKINDLNKEIQYLELSLIEYKRKKYDLLLQ